MCMEYRQFTLQEIARINLQDSSADSILRLPEVQRGLVWKPRQVELLWDSILSGYPIGSFMVVNNELYDGQQRITAIISGFDYMALRNKMTPNSILWLDLAFTEEDNLARRYGFRLTTKAHPWGYHIKDENDGVFSTKERCEIIEATKQFYNNLSDNKEEWDIRMFTPHKATLPIPFAIILNALFDDHAEFEKKIIEDTAKFAADHCKSLVWVENEEQVNVAKEYLRQLYGTLQSLRDYKVLANIIKASTNDNKKYLELFFNRINTGGTPITQEELAYSAIKLYWQDEADCKIALTNRHFAEKYLPEAKFAQIVFRAMCSTDTIRGEINATYIRNLKNDRETVATINSLYQNDGKRLDDIMKRMEENFTLIPKFVRVEIARQTPTLYILLFTIAKLQKEGYMNSISSDFITSLTLYLYCCSTSNNPHIATQYIYKNIKQNPQSVCEDSIRRWIADCISYHWSYYITPSAENYRGFADENIISEHWNIWNYQNEPGGAVICHMFSYGNNFHQLAMLKVAERKAFCKFFNDYNPIRQDLWEESNRPWDDDHIVPKSWVERAQSEWRESCKKWIWSIGNIAHIPFQENRAKNANADWDFYFKNKELLHFNDNIITIPKDFVYDKEKVTSFIKATKKRFCNIYADFAKLLEPLGIGENLSDIQEIRKRLLINYKEEGCIFYYVAGENDIEFDEHSNYGWMQTWVTVAKPNPDGTTNAITIGLPKRKLEDSMFPVEIGVRKQPNKSLSDTDNHSWWHKNQVEDRYFTIEDMQEGGKADLFIKECLLN